MKLLAILLACITLSTAQAASFKGYPCSQDCSGHRAGYEWAKRKGITRTAECTGNSRSFVEGCRAWAEGK